MVEAVLRRLHPRWLARVEVPISGSVRGVADLVLDERTARMTIVGEAQSEFRGLEERIRWFAEKTEAISERLKRDGRPREVSRLLIILSTVNTREMARRYAATLSAAYPASSTAVFDALTGTSTWPGAGIIWVRLDRGVAELLRRPPRGVVVGR